MAQLAPCRLHRPSGPQRTAKPVDWRHEDAHSTKLTAIAAGEPQAIAPSLAPKANAPAGWLSCGLSLSWNHIRADGRIPARQADPLFEVPSLVENQHEADMLGGAHPAGLTTHDHFEPPVAVKIGNADKSR